MACIAITRFMLAKGSAGVGIVAMAWHFDKQKYDPNYFKLSTTYPPETKTIGTKFSFNWSKKLSSSSGN